MSRELINWKTEVRKKRGRPRRAWKDGIYIYIQGVTGGTDQTSGECSLGQTIPI